MQLKAMAALTSRIVDVYDHRGGHIAAYTVCLEDEDCLDCEFEEVAIAFAEQSGKLATASVRNLIARCHREI
jgi:hypothetical protein